MSNGNLTGQTSESGLAGVYGGNTGAEGVGVAGVSTTGDGVRAVSQSGNGLSAFTTAGVAVFAQAHTQPGVVGESDSNDGVRAVSQSGNGLSAFSTTGTGVYAKGVTNAAYFDGNVDVAGDMQVTGDIRLKNGDGAEEFDTTDAAPADPGTVMVLGGDGTLAESQQPYDTKVAGVISGAGDLRAGIILGTRDSQKQGTPLALFGKVHCKVDAQYGAVEVGDLLTTSATPGYAMKAHDPLKAFGSVIGKAMQPLTAGQGLIPILIALQ